MPCRSCYLNEAFLLSSRSALTPDLELAFLGLRLGPWVINNHYLIYSQYIQLDDGARGSARRRILSKQPLCGQSSRIVHPLNSILYLLFHWSSPSLSNSSFILSLLLNKNLNGIERSSNLSNDSIYPLWSNIFPRIHWNLLFENLTLQERQCLNSSKSAGQARFCKTFAYSTYCQKANLVPFFY